MKIAFFDNGNLSLLFGEVENKLNDEGVESYLIAFSKKKKNFLERNNIKNVVYLDINKGNINEGRKIIQTIEKNIPEFRLYRAIELDRILKYKEENETINFLFKFAHSIFAFVKDSNINYIFGEVTWAIEYITYFVMEHLNRKYYNPMNNYVIPGRFAFLDYKNSKSFIKKDFSKYDLKEAKKIYENRLKQDINKNTQFLQTYIPHNWKKRLNNLYQSYNTEDYRYSLNLKIRILQKYFNRLIVNHFFKKTIDIPFLKGNKNKYKYAILNLHIQPEATPDVVSTYYNDQFRLIEVIRASLPANFILLIKEHPNGIGSRNIGWLKRVSNIPGVKLINPKIPMINLFDYVDIVFSIAGTVAFESSLHNIPAIIFSDVFLEIFPLVRKEKDFDNLPLVINDLLNHKIDKEYTKEKNIEAIAKIYANTFEGNIYDPFLNPDVLNSKNVENISKAIKTIINEE